ncbi:MAG TPA: hypothetical protein VFA90_09940 [Terriglobales bacterium]|nr:hypothetical protein [Terriglobales bacterium]
MSLHFPWTQVLLALGASAFHQPQALRVLSRMRTARIQGGKDFVASLSSGSQFQKSLQTFVPWTVDRKNIQACGVRRIMNALYKPGFNKRIQSSGYQVHVASYKSSDLLAGQERSRMPVQENQKVEITAVSDYGSLNE